MCFRCDGAGANCKGANCNTAFHKTDDYQVQVQCTAANVSARIPHIVFPLLIAL